MTAALIRSGGRGDLPALVRIYNHYVTTSHVTFDTEPFSTQDRLPWFESFSESGPHRLLVAEVGGRVVGYACSRGLRPKPAYHTSVETTIYLDPEHTGRGLGGQLYEALIRSLDEEATVHRAYAGVALPNPGSVALHERLGFRLAGTFREVGYKFGRYWDVSWYEKDCSSRGTSGPPQGGTPAQ